MIALCHLSARQLERWFTSRAGVMSPIDIDTGVLIPGKTGVVYWISFTPGWACKDERPRLTPG